MTDKICFVIQPFSEPYNKRFEDIYKPAIEYVGLVPYRAGGPAAEVITEDIENGIRNAHICFADITENNPNVWYEVGFSYACGKSVVMVCNKEVRDGKELPFDISVKNVIFYKNLVDSYDLDRSKFTQKIIDQARERVKKADSNRTVSSVTGKKAKSSGNKNLRSEPFHLSIATRQPKNSDNEILRNKGIAFPIDTRQSEISGGFTSFDGKVLKIIFTHYSKHNHPIVRRGITAEFPDAEEGDVLISLNRLELEKFITRTKIKGFLGGSEPGYSPTEKGQQWIRDNSRD